MTESSAPTVTPLQAPDGPIRQTEWEERRSKLSQILVGIARHADVQMSTRCPYKNRLDQCTSPFGCRNKRKPAGLGELPRCVGSDEIDYRSAWEVEPESYEPMRRAISAPARGNREARERLRGHS